MLSVLSCSALGTVLGFLAGLVPGLHMNNIAAAITAYSSAAIAALGTAFWADDQGDSSVLVSCFISSAVVSHIFSESVVSTYVGIPDEDVVSVLPAHRLAKAGLGTLSVRSHAEGALAGVLYGAALVFPVSLLMGSPLFGYGVVSELMPLIVSFLILLLLASEGYPSLRFRHPVPNHLSKVLAALTVFLASGVLGTAALLTNYYAAPIPDFPWMGDRFVPRSSLLLPMFAGFFGVPSLLLSLGSRPLPGIIFPEAVRLRLVPSLREILTMLMGGVMVGWLPGMTSGSAAAACSPSSGEQLSREGVSSASRFVWLYSAISASGAVMSVGALFVIGRARSGFMDAVSLFLGGSLDQGAWLQLVPLMSTILLSMVFSSVLSYAVLARCLPILSGSSKFLCSKGLAVSSLMFVIGLSLYLTGARGALLMGAASSLGILAPLMGIRRLQLMGSLLVPIWILYATMG